MNSIPDTTRQYAAVTHLNEEARSTVDRIMAQVHVARRLDATAETYRLRATELDRQADRAANLLFGKAVETFRAAAAEERFVADALDAPYGRADLY